MLVGIHSKTIGGGKS